MTQNTVNNQINRVSIIGLGKLGSPMAAVFAASGFSVIGVDLNSSFVEAINQNIAPVNEVGLQDMLDKGKANLRATTDYEDAVLHSDITFIIVPTPSDNMGIFTNRYILNSIEQIGAALRKKKDFHIVVITSTVMPGSTGSVIKEALEKSSGRRVGEEMGLCYNPEFIALGSVIKDMLYPDFLLIGESDTKTGDIVESIYKKICLNQPAVRRMNFVNAELTKISVNTFVTTKIAYANMLSELCDHLPEADVDIVTDAVGSDSRIGKKYLRGALGYGGPCFPRDNIAFSALAKGLNVRSDLAFATHTMNQYQAERIVSFIEKLPNNGTIGIAGLSYKPNTEVCEESPALYIANALSKTHRSVRVYDYFPIDSSKINVAHSIECFTNFPSFISDCDIMLLTVASPNFVEDLEKNQHLLAKNVIILDFWRIIPDRNKWPHVKIMHFGKGENATLLHDELALT